HGDAHPSVLRDANDVAACCPMPHELVGRDFPTFARRWTHRAPARLAEAPPARGRDRKSTRLNSSHVSISYAVFCLKKKKHDTRLVGTDPTNAPSPPSRPHVQNMRTPHVGHR